MLLRTFLCCFSFRSGVAEGMRYQISLIKYTAIAWNGSMKFIISHVFVNEKEEFLESEQCRML